MGEEERQTRLDSYNAVLFDTTETAKKIYTQCQSEWSRAKEHKRAVRVEFELSSTEFSITTRRRSRGVLSSSRATAHAGMRAE